VIERQRTTILAASNSLHSIAHLAFELAIKHRLREEQRTTHLIDVCAVSPQLALRYLIGLWLAHVQTLVEKAFVATAQQIELWIVELWIVVLMASSIPFSQQTTMSVGVFMCVATSAATNDSQIDLLETRCALRRKLAVKHNAYARATLLRRVGLQQSMHCLWCCAIYHHKQTHARTRTRTQQILLLFAIQKDTQPHTHTSIL
jgi:hypothetical protein